MRERLEKQANAEFRSLNNYVNKVLSEHTNEQLAYKRTRAPRRKRAQPTPTEEVK